MATGFASTLKRLWRHNRWLTLSFVLTMVLALVFIIRASIFFIYWQQHRDEPIEGWMTIRYIANSYRVDPKLVHTTIGLEKGKPDHRPLFKIAVERGQSLDDLTQKILQAIEADRTAKALPDRPAAVPPPPAPTPPSSPKAPSQP